MGCSNSRQAEETPIFSVEVKRVDVRHPSVVVQHVRERPESVSSFSNQLNGIVNEALQESERIGRRPTNDVSAEHRGPQNMTPENSPADAPVPVSVDETSAMQTPENPAAIPDNETGHMDSTNEGPTPPSPPRLPTPPPPGVKCSYCCEEIPDQKEDTILRPCKGCSVPSCNGCIRKMFMNACRSEADMPPRCCAPIPITIARSILSHEEVTLFKEKYEEWSTPNRVYCPVPTCSAFIPHRLFPAPAAMMKGKIPAQDSGRQNQNIPAGLQTPPLTPPLPESDSLTLISCPKCAVSICCSCKQLAHPGTACSETPDLDPELAELLRRWGVKRCPKCRAAVRRMYGCSHMQCRCGAQWCWWCMGPIRVCRIRSCPAEHEASAFETQILEDGDEYFERNDPDRDVEVIEAADTPGAPQEATEESANEAQSQAPASEPGLERERILNLDAGHHWEDAGADFGSEPNIDETDPFDCTHSWNSVELGEGDDAMAEIECTRCWRTLVPRPNGYIYIGIKDLVENGSITAEAATEDHTMGDGNKEGFINTCHSCGISLCDDCRALARHERRR